MNNKRNIVGRRDWTKEEIKFLEENWTKISDNEIGLELGRTSSSVRLRREKLGLVKKLKVVKLEDIPKTEWRQIEGFKYSISPIGLVLNNEKGTIINNTKDDSGYSSVTLYNLDGNRKTFRVHRLVATHFLEKPVSSEDLIINHKDGNKTNPHIDNLGWVTYSENSIHSFQNSLQVPKKGSTNSNSKLTEEIVHEICKLLELGLTAPSIREKLGLNNIANETIRGIRSKKSWTHVSQHYNIFLIQNK